MNLALNAGVYLRPTPAGAFFAAAEPGQDRLRSFLVSLLSLPESPQAEAEPIIAWSRSPDLAYALDFVGHLQQRGWIEGLPAPRRAPDGPLESLLPVLLAAIAPEGRILLADSFGFQVCSLGFEPAVGEELAALSADLARLHERHYRSLGSRLGFKSSAWALTNAAGHSQIGFWPLYAGSERFVLVIRGDPLFTAQQLVDLIWLLHLRYATPLSPLDPH